MSYNVGIAIREARRAQKMTLRDLAKKTGIDYSMISKYENGLVNPPPEKLNLIKTALNILDDAVLPDDQLLEMDIAARRRSVFARVNEDQLIVSDSAANQAVLSSVNGKCELCGQVFPDGEHFLEAHHIKWLQDGGTPTIDNTVALCPNCHKRIHLYNDPADLAALKKAAKKHK